jgi:proteasome alpha subunit
VTMPFYTSPEQLMRERSELARKGIARGRSVVVLKYAGGVLFVAENPSTTLHKVSEIYDRIGFAAVGRYSEFENLRMGGIRMADVRGYSYDRRDVTGRALANTYAQTLGAIFTEQVKPFEVEICVAEVGTTADGDQLYRLTYDGSIVDEPRFVVMGGQAETITSTLKDSYSDGLELAAAIELAIRGLSSGGESSRELAVGQLEVAVLERSRPNRTFRRITGAALRSLLPGAESAAAEDAGAESSDGEA